MPFIKIIKRSEAMSETFTRIARISVATGKIFEEIAVMYGVTRVALAIRQDLRADPGLAGLETSDAMYGS